MTRYPGYIKLHKDKKMRYLKLSGFEMNVLYETISNANRGYTTGELRDVGKLLDQIESHGTEVDSGYVFKFEEDEVLTISEKQLKLVQEVMKEMKWSGKFARKILSFLEKVDNASTVDPRDTHAAEAAPEVGIAQE